MYCKDCGHWMTELRVPRKYSSWESRYRCDSCGLRMQIGYGDAMGGQMDSYHFQDHPFEKERRK